MIGRPLLGSHENHPMTTSSTPIHSVTGAVCDSGRKAHQGGSTHGWWGCYVAAAGGGARICTSVWGCSRVGGWRGAHCGGTLGWYGTVVVCMCVCAWVATY